MKRSAQVHNLLNSGTNRAPFSSHWRCHFGAPLITILVLAMFTTPGKLRAAEVVTATATVEEVSGKKITTDQGRSYTVDDKTEIVKKTDGADEKAKLADIKSGAKIEIQMEKGAKTVKLIRILSP